MRHFLVGRCVSLVVILVAASVGRAQDNVRGSSEPIVSSIDPSKLTYDILVDGNLPADDPEGKKFKTLQAAYESASAGTEARPTVIGIRPNVYHIDGSTERVPSLRITKNWITLLGLTNNRRAVVLADNRGLDEGASDDGYLLDVNATGFTARNLTILNYCNCDYEYPSDASKNLSMRNPTITQAVALQAAGDKHVYENVAILGRLDTMFLRTMRSYFKNVYIEGTDDWMGGGQMSAWEDCDLVYPTGGGVMSASSVVFIGCRFHATRGMEFYKEEFGAAARPDALINCVLPVTKNGIAWVRGNAPAYPSQYSLTYHNTDADGHAAAIKDDNMRGTATTISRELSDKEMSAYNPWNLLRGADDWDPAGVKGKYASAAPDNPVFRIALNVGTSGGRRGGDTSGAAASIRTGGNGVNISATVLPADTADQNISWSTKSDLVSLSATRGPQVTVTGKNTTENAQYVPITTTASDGFYVTTFIYVEPKYVDPPVVTGAPKILAPADGKVSVDYTLDLGGREDQSLISWFACDDANGGNAKKIAVSRGNQPLKTYTLERGDIGKFLRVSIEPKHHLSEAGPAVLAMSSAAIAPGDVPSTTASPSFRDFVETPSDELVAGRWFVQGAWSIAAGNGFENGFGIRAVGRGGRNPGGGIGLPPTNPLNSATAPVPGASSLVYFMDGNVGDMQMVLTMTPDKTEGTVFAIPGAPDGNGPGHEHGDFFIKYDPRTASGYSLRYWRTTQSASACTYQFYKIDHGIASPLDDHQVQSGVFKRDTKLILKTVGNRISVMATNTADKQTLKMEGTITPNAFGGAGVWSTGASTTYSGITISYP